MVVLAFLRHETLQIASEQTAASHVDTSFAHILI